MRSELMSSENLSENTLIVSIDFGKSTHMGYARGSGGTELKSFEFENSGRGYRDFWERITSFYAKTGHIDLVVGFESTSSYGEGLKRFLLNRRVRLVQVNPMHTKRIKELADNSPNKTDRKDPGVIADIIALGRALTVVVPEGAAAHLRYLVHARERQLEDLNRIINRIEGLVASYFPEFLLIIKNLSSKSSLYLLEKYPTPESLISLGVKRLARHLRRVSRGRFGQEQALELVEAAKSNEGGHEGLESLLYELRYLVLDYGKKDQQKRKLEGLISVKLKEIPYGDLLLSIKGLGQMVVAGLIGEVGDFRNYRTIGEILKLAGLNLYEVSSGRHQGKRRISKRGRSLMRKLLYFGALRLIKKGALYHETYQRYVQRGMKKMMALVVIIRKLLRVMFAMVRDQCEFDPAHLTVNVHQAA